MNRQAAPAATRPMLNRSGECFRLAFQQRWREHLARYQAEPRAFQRLWEQTLQRHPLDPASQTRLQWELMDWARSYEQFTAANPSEYTGHSSPLP